MNYPLSLILLLIAAACAGCAEFPGQIHFTTNPDGVITAGVRISPDVIVIMPEK